MTDSDRGRRIPADSFRIRLAIVRAEMGWNYDQAEAATGVGKESWRQWEKGLRHCSDVIGVSRRIADATPFDQTWLALGGPLAPAEDPASIKRSRNEHSRRCTAFVTRRRDAHRAISCSQSIAA